MTRTLDEFTTPTPTSIRIVRRFDAPVELVWRAIPSLSQEARDAAMQPGFQEGFAASYDQLDALLPELEG